MTPPTGKQQDHYGDEAKVRLLFDRCLDDSRGNHARLERDRQDIWNLMFYRGGEANQWSIFNSTSGQYEPRPYDGEVGIPAWIKRCTTNKFARKIDGIAAILNQSSPAKTFVPMTDDDEDRATAEVAEDADPVLLEEVGYERLKRRIHQLITLTNGCAVVYWFDTDEKYGTAPIGLMTCLDCGGEPFTPMEAGGAPTQELEAEVDVPPDAMAEGQPEALTCPHCGSPQVDMLVDPATQIQVGVDYPRGKLCADIWTSYEYSLPSSATVADADEVPWVLGHKRMSIEDACSAWPDHAREIRSRAGGTSKQESALTRQYAEQMRQLSSPRSTRSYDASNKNSVTVYRLLHDQITDDAVSFSKGLQAVMVDDIIVDKNPLPLKDASGCYRKNVILRQYADTPATPFGKPPADDLLPLQQQRNLCETLIFMIHMHHASPVTYMPAGVTLEDEPTGMPGAIHRYRSLVPGERPFTESGKSPAEGLYRTVEMQDEAMEDISGLNSVLGGARPAGDPTLGEVQILQERGMAAFRTPLDHLIDFEKRQSRLLLDLARQTAWAPRFRKVEGENGRWNVTQFTAADLTGQVDISIEPLSAWPKSPSMQMVKLQKAIELGVLMPQQDPEVSTKILAMLGLSELKPSLDADKQQVARELDRWKAATMPQQIEPPALESIEAPIHLFLKKQFLKTEEAEELKRANPAVYQAMVLHVQALQMAVTPPQMPAPDPNAKPPGPDGTAVEGAVNAGALLPAGAAPGPQGPPPLDAAVNSGALMPAGVMAAQQAAQQPQGPSIDDLMAQGALTPVPPPAAGLGAPAP
jgi:hypothetical protein